MDGVRPVKNTEMYCLVFHAILHRDTASVLSGFWDTRERHDTKRPAIDDDLPTL